MWRAHLITLCHSGPFLAVVGAVPAGMPSVSSSHQAGVGNDNMSDQDDCIVR